MAKTVVLDVGLCSCVKDWQGKLDGYAFNVCGRSFQLKELVVEDGKVHRSHVFIDRHFFSNPHFGKGYDVFIYFLQAYPFQPDRKYDPAATFASYKEIVSRHWTQLRKPSYVTARKSIESMAREVTEGYGLEGWLQGFEEVKNLPLLG